MKFTRSVARVATGGFDFFFFTSTLYHTGSVIFTVAGLFVSSATARREAALVRVVAFG
jgi:uncharacterized membrane protein